VLPRRVDECLNISAVDGAVHPQRFTLSFRRGEESHGETWLSLTVVDPCEPRQREHEVASLASRPEFVQALAEHGLSSIVLAGRHQRQAEIRHDDGDVALLPKTTVLAEPLLRATYRPCRLTRLAPVDAEIVVCERDHRLIACLVSQAQRFFGEP